MRENAKVEQRHVHAALMCGFASQPFAQALANAEQRGREDEREECAKLCGAPDHDPQEDNPESGNYDDYFAWGVECASYWNAAAIRARG